MNPDVPVKTHETIQWAYIINSSHHCVYVYPLVVVRLRFGKIVTLATNAYETGENCWTRHFLNGPRRVTRKRAIGSCRNRLLTVL
jgi:hypothetical protein